MSNAVVPNSISQEANVNHDLTSYEIARLGHFFVSRRISSYATLRSSEVVVSHNSSQYVVPRSSRTVRTETPSFKICSRDKSKSDTRDAQRHECEGPVPSHVRRDEVPNTRRHKSRQRTTDRIGEDYQRRTTTP